MRAFQLLWIWFSKLLACSLLSKHTHHSFGSIFSRAIHRGDSYKRPRWVPDNWRRLSIGKLKKKKKKNLFLTFGASLNKHNNHNQTQTTFPMGLLCIRSFISMFSSATTSTITFFSTQNILQIIFNIYCYRSLNILTFVLSMGWTDTVRGVIMFCRVRVWLRFFLLVVVVIRLPLFDWLFAQSVYFIFIQHTFSLSHSFHVYLMRRACSDHFIYSIMTSHIFNNRQLFVLFSKPNLFQHKIKHL